MTNTKLLNNIQELAVKILNEYQSTDKFEVTLTAADIVNILNSIYDFVNDFEDNEDILNFQSIVTNFNKNIKKK